MLGTLEKSVIVIDADEVLEDVDLISARADINAEVDAVVELAISYLPADVREAKAYTVDRAGIVAAVKASL